jgi:hypothetical protein
MVRKKPSEKYEEPIEEDYEEPIVEEEQDSLEYETHSSGAESIVNKPTIDNFFNTEQLLQEIEKTMKGYQKVNGSWVYTTTPKARDSFINSMMNRLRSVINQQNMVSYMVMDDIKFLLLEKNKDFIFSVYDEPSIEDEDVESIINIFDHALQIFMGHVNSGFGARTLRQIAAAVAYEVDDKNKDNSLLSFGIGDTNLVSIGGNKK